jgi:hypothetical protein
MTLPKKEGILPIPIATFVFRPPPVSIAALRGRPPGARTRKPIECSICHKTGHNRTKCKDAPPPDPPESQP